MKEDFIEENGIEKEKEYYYYNGDTFEYDGKVKFEGEYLNGKRFKGQEYSYEYYDNIKKENLEKIKEKEQEEQKTKGEKYGLLQCILI